MVVQRLGTCLPRQGPWVRSLVQEDPTFLGVTKPEPPQLLKPVCLESVIHNRRSHRTEKPAYHSEE